MVKEQLLRQWLNITHSELKTVTCFHLIKINTFHYTIWMLQITYSWYAAVSLVIHFLYFHLKLHYHHQQRNIFNNQLLLLCNVSHACVRLTMVMHSKLFRHYVHKDGCTVHNSGQIWIQSILPSKFKTLGVKITHRLFRGFHSWKTLSTVWI